LEDAGFAAKRTWLDRRQWYSLTLAVLLDV
jgi:hypothetical protein